MSIRILVVDADRRHRRWLAQIIRAICEPEVVESLAEVPAEGAYDMVIVNYDLAMPEEVERLITGFAGYDEGPRLILVSDGKCRDDFFELFDRGLMRNLLAYNEGFDVDEFIVTVQKLLREDLFGIEKYFTWGVEPRVVALTSSTEKASVLGLLEDYGNSLGIHKRFTTALCTVADELVTNALYNAPVDADGHAPFKHLPRTQQVKLAPGEEVELKFCYDGRRVGISTSDPFGSLTQEEVLRYLAKCFRGGRDQVDDKEGGAGLGLFYVFDNLSHLIVNIAPGERTEIIGFLDVSQSYRDFATKTKSFNIFVGR